MSEVYGLLGRNIGFSKSPKIHNFMSKHLNIEFNYEIFDIEESEISKLLKNVRNQTIKGLNVTVPYKNTVIKYLDILTPKASRIRAVNVIYLKNGKLVGDNTDYDGFLGLLQYHKINVKDKRVYILGSGGASKAVYTVLKDLDAFVTVVSRKTIELDTIFQNVISYKKLDPFQVDIYIQATPIGTYPNIEESVLTKVYVENQTVIDLIYNPPVTKIMQLAKKGINGILMLIIQAIKSEEIWFNRKINLTDELLRQIKEVIYHE
jgi:shikimate dehydrogenase